MLRRQLRAQWCAAARASQVVPNLGPMAAARSLSVHAAPCKASVCVFSPFQLINWHAVFPPCVLLSGAASGSYLDVVSLTPHFQLRTLRQCDGRPLRLAFGVALPWALVCVWLASVDFGGFRARF